MNPYKFEIKPTSKASILKFEANRFLTQHAGYEFSSKKEALISPMGLLLFEKFPEIGKIYIAQNFVAVEVQDESTWPSVKNAIASTLESFLNAGGKIIQEKPEKKKRPVSVYIESTKNPEVMRFVSSIKLVVSPTNFKNIIDAKHAPLARELFLLPYVKGVQFEENFISIMKKETADWNEINLELREFIRHYLMQGKEIINEDIEPLPEAEFHSFHEIKKIKKERSFVPPSSVGTLDKTSQRIIEILNTEIRVALAANYPVFFQSYDADTKVLKLLLKSTEKDTVSIDDAKRIIQEKLDVLLPDSVNLVELVKS